MHGGNEGRGQCGEAQSAGDSHVDEVGEAGGFQTAHCKDLGFQLIEMGPLKGLSRVT